MHVPNTVASKPRPAFVWCQPGTWRKSWPGWTSSGRLGWTVALQVRLVSVPSWTAFLRVVLFVDCV